MCTGFLSRFVVALSRYLRQAGGATAQPHMASVATSRPHRVQRWGWSFLGGLCWELSRLRVKLLFIGLYILSPVQFCSCVHHFSFGNFGAFQSIAFISLPCLILLTKAVVIHNSMGLLHLVSGRVDLFLCLPY